MMRLSGLCGFSFLASLLFSCGTVTDFFISDEQEVELGEQFSLEIEADTTTYPLYENRSDHNPALVAYIDSIGSVLAQAQNDRPRIEYHFAIIDNDTVVNAFAVPGGFVYIYTGLLLEADNEAEVAGVLAHELGHITKRHGAQTLMRQYGYNYLLDIIVRNDSSALRTILNAATGIVFLKHSKNNEYEADACAVEYLTDAGYNPIGMKTFLQKLTEGRGWVFEPLSSHPDPEKRVESVAALIEQKPASVQDRPIPDLQYAP